MLHQGRFIKKIVGSAFHMLGVETVSPTATRLCDINLLSYSRIQVLGSWKLFCSLIRKSLTRSFYFVSTFLTPPILVSFYPWNAEEMCFFFIGAIAFSVHLIVASGKHW